MRGCIGLVLAALCIGVAAEASTPAGGAGDGQGSLSGKAKWDPKVWTYYCKQEYELDVPAEPQAFQQKELLGGLNGEFARRLKCIIAVYQTASHLNNLGLAPGSGGIRSASDQKSIYMVGRKLKDGLTDPPAGKFAEDYEVVNPGQVETKAWVSWHELGVAVDLREFVGSKVKQPQDTPQTKAFWHDTVVAMNDLGMIWGGYWPWDYGHVEWHPYLRSAERKDAQGHLVAIIGTPGQALTDQQMKYGYDWKIPQTLVDWNGTDADPAASEQIMRVYTLVERDGWLCMKKRRTIERRGDKHYLDAYWDTFDPPVPLVPTYSPVTHLMLDSHDDSQWAPSSTVTTEHDSLQVRSDGKSYTAYERLTGKVHFTFSVYIHDWQKTAIVALEVAGYPSGLEMPPSSLQQTNPQAYQARLNAYQKAQASMKKRGDTAEAFYKNVIKASVYDVEVRLGSDSKFAEPVRTQTRAVDVDGYTTDGDNTATYAMGVLPMLLQFSWDRDAGNIGVGPLDQMVDNDHPSLEVRGVQSSASSPFITLIADRAPKSISDIVTPPDWPGANPKPKPSSRPTSPGQFLMP